MCSWASSGLSCFWSQSSSCHLQALLSEDVGLQGRSPVARAPVHWLRRRQREVWRLVMHLLSVSLSLTPASVGVVPLNNGGCPSLGALSWGASPAGGASSLAIVSSVSARIKALQALYSSTMACVHRLVRLLRRPITPPLFVLSGWASPSYMRTWLGYH